jgi:putative FmdB family regulatory protein
MLKMFDFECKECNLKIEKLIREKDIVICPECGRVMTKLIGAPPFHLKGDGWSSDNYGLKK